MSTPQVRTVSKVLVEFSDGETEAYSVPEGAGFVRKNYTYEASDKEVTGIRKWARRLLTYEIFWTEDVPND